MSNERPCNKLWALLSIDPQGNEGIVAMNTPIGPQVGITMEPRILEIYKQTARDGFNEAKAAGVKLVVAEFVRAGTEPLV